MRIMKRTELCSVLFWSGRDLPPGVVDGVVPSEDEFGNGDDLIPLALEILDDPGECLRGVECGVVEQDDAPRPYIGGDPGVDLIGSQILPVQTIPTGSTFKCPQKQPLRAIKNIYTRGTTPSIHTLEGFYPAGCLWLFHRTRSRLWEISR